MDSHRPHRLSLEDLYKLPDDGTRYELHGGYLVAEPAPGPRHGRIEVWLGAALVAHVRETSSGVVMTNTTFVLARGPDTVRAPDIAFVTAERYRALDDEARSFPGHPDLAIEVLSPSNRPAEMRARIADYLAAGTPLVWVVDPVALNVTVYRHGGSAEVLDANATLSASPALSTFSMPVAEIFDIGP